MAAGRSSLGVSRGLRLAAGLFCLYFAAPVAHAVDDPRFAGSYKGVGAASGMAMALAEEGGEVYGRVVDGRNNTWQLSGQIDGGAVRGRLYSPTADAAFQLAVKAPGLQFMLIPTSADGEPNPAAMKQYAFARGKVTSPALADFRVEPPRRGATVDLAAFLQNYRSWKAADVAIAYSGIPDHERALINKFDHLQADLMNRLCRGGAPRASIMSASENQDVGCDELTALIDKAAAQGALKSFDDSAINQMSSLYGVVACNLDRFPPGRCVNAGAIPKQAAQSWQSAGAIFKDVSALGFRSGAVSDELVALNMATAAPAAIAPQTTTVRAASLPPQTEQRALALLKQAKRVPAPRDRPVFFKAGGTAGASARVDELVLASADQSAQVKRPVRAMSFKEGFGFQLRPTLAETQEAAASTRFATSTVKRVVTRLRPRPADAKPAVAEVPAVLATPAVPRSASANAAIPRGRP